MQPAAEKSDAPRLDDVTFSDFALLEPNSADLSLMLVGTSFRKSPIAFRESLFRYFSDPKLRDVVHNLPHVSESVLLTTCNRIEAYFATSSVASTSRAFFKLVDPLACSRPDWFYEYEGTGAITHLFSVASGLDSMVLGEEQIIEQVRETSISERVTGHSKAALTALFDASYNAGRRIRSQSKERTDSSVSAFALKFALKKLGHRPRTTTLIGTGKTIRLAAMQLKASQLFVVTSRDAPSLSLENVKLVRREQLREFASESELIIAATKHSGYLLGKDDLRGGARRVVLDLGFPRNVDPAVKELESTSLYDLDALAREAAGGQATADRAAADARRRVAREAAIFQRWLIASRLSAQLPKLYRWGEKVRGEELSTALRRLPRLSEREKHVIAAMSRRLVSKILSRPTRFVKNSDAGMAQNDKLSLVEKVFMLEYRDEV